MSGESRSERETVACAFRYTRIARDKSRANRTGARLYRVPSRRDISFEKGKGRGVARVRRLGLGLGLRRAALRRAGCLQSLWMALRSNGGTRPGAGKRNCREEGDSTQRRESRRRCAHLRGTLEQFARLETRRRCAVCHAPFVSLYTGNRDAKVTLDARRPKH